MTATSENMHEAEKEAKSLNAQAQELASKNRELRQFVAAAVGQLRYAQFLLAEPVHARSQQIDEFIEKLEGALK